MVVKINDKTIRIVEDEDESTFSPIYLGVSCIGYGMILILMDYCCFVFFGSHFLPFLPWLLKAFAWVF